MQSELIADCVHCGFCLPTCPTYTLWHEEMDSPRGRIHLMSGLVDGTIDLTDTVVEHFDRCLGCMACVPACPSGVQYDRLIETTRAHIEERQRRGAGERLLRRLIFEVFEVADRKWRGVGMIPKSGYRLRWEYHDHDAERLFEVEDIQTQESPVCISGLVLKGVKRPPDCPAFGKACTPQHPLGATMVSAEGACAAYYSYGRHLEPAGLTAKGG